MQYNCVIIDDNELDRLMTVSFVKRHPEFKICGIFDSAEQAYPTIIKDNVQILFLDIDMPETSGIELRKQFLEIPACVFITAFPEHAIASFEASAIDFLVKPVKYQRFEAAAQRVIDYLELKRKADLFQSNYSTDAVFIREGRNEVKINMLDIQYLEALRDYTKIESDNGSHHMLSTMGSLLESPEFSSFVRIHRSFAVPKHQVAKLGAKEVELLNSKKIPVGRNFKKNLELLR